jgi:hypothetical protein
MEGTWKGDATARSSRRVQMSTNCARTVGEGASMTTMYSRILSRNSFLPVLARNRRYTAHACGHAQARLQAGGQVLNQGCTLPSTLPIQTVSRNRRRCKHTQTARAHAASHSAYHPPYLTSRRTTPRKRQGMHIRTRKHGHGDTERDSEKRETERERARARASDAEKGHRKEATCHSSKCG